MIDEDKRIFDILDKMAWAIPKVANCRLAAAITFKNSIVSFGVSQRKSHPFQAKFSKNSDSIFLHAETDAIKNALRIVDVDHLKKCTLYVHRVKHADDHRTRINGLAKPCIGCMKAIFTFGISKVKYSLNNHGWEML